MAIDSTDLSYISIIWAGACFIVPARDLITNTRRTGLNRITPIGWTLFLIALLSGVTSFYTIKVTAGEKQESQTISDNQRQSDSLHIEKMSKKFDSLGFTYNANTNFLSKKIDSLKQLKSSMNNEALLGICVAFTPTMQVDDSNDLRFEIRLCNISDGVAQNMHDNLMLLEIKNDNVYKLPYKQKNNPFINESNMVPPDGFIGADYDLGHIASMPINDTVDVYYNLSYTNMKGKPGRPIRSILEWVTPKSQVYEVGSYRYKIVKQYLQQNRLW